MQAYLYNGRKWLLHIVTIVYICAMKNSAYCSVGNK